MTYDEFWDLTDEKDYRTIVWQETSSGEFVFEKQTIIGIIERSLYNNKCFFVYRPQKIAQRIFYNQVLEVY